VLGIYITVGMDTDLTKQLKFVGLGPVSAENRILKTFRKGDSPSRPYMTFKHTLWTTKMRNFTNQIYRHL